MPKKAKKILICVLDVLLLGYVVLGLTSFQKKPTERPVCTRLNVEIEENSDNGFLTKGEIRRILQTNRLSPVGKKSSEISLRRIEEVLKGSPFVRSAQCCMAQNGDVSVRVTQLLPVLRIKSLLKEDYYIDDKGGVMPNSKYTSDLVIATGHITKSYAKNYLTPLANAINGNELFSSLIEQINILPNRGVEIVPRVGDHVVYIGQLPQNRYKKQRDRLIEEYLNRKLMRLRKFYKYGLNQVGWNKYYYINLEFDNQIICKKQMQEPLS